jgi:hypothetical protein
MTMSLQWKPPAWGLAIAGAIVGLTAGPWGLVIGGVLGGAFDTLRSGHRRKWSLSNPLDEHQLRAVRPLAPHLSDDAHQYKAAVSRPTPEAGALHDLLGMFAGHRHKEKFWTHEKTRDTVARFQQSFNADRGMRAGVPPLQEDGAFDRRTAAALAMYTRHPVSPDPRANAER